MWLLQSKQGSMKLVREIPWTAFSIVYYLDVLLIIRLYKFYHFILGIGAGLESMTTNQMSWDGDVNPKVYLLFSSFNLFQKVCWWFFLWLFIIWIGFLRLYWLWQLKNFQKAQDCLLPMGITSENVAHRFGVTRQEQDQAAVSAIVLLCSILQRDLFY